MVHSARSPLLSSWFCSSSLSLEDTWQKRGTTVKNFSYKSNRTTTYQYGNCDKNTNTCVFSPSTNSSVFITAVLLEKCSWTSSHHWLLVTSFCSSPSSSNQSAHPALPVCPWWISRSGSCSCYVPCSSLHSHSNLKLLVNSDWWDEKTLLCVCSFQCYLLLSRRTRKSITHCCDVSD